MDDIQSKQNGEQKGGGSGGGVIRFEVTNFIQEELFSENIIMIKLLPPLSRPQFRLHLFNISFL